MKEFAPDDPVLVSPRYLAGGGRTNDVLGPLIHLFKWPYEHNMHTGRIHIDSPCGSIFVDFAPAREDGVWWTIAHHDPYWQVEFGRQTPAEAIASVTQALPQLLGDQRHADRSPLATESVADLAKSSGWAAKGTISGVTWTSPDEHCTVEHSAEPVHPWRFAHSVHDGFGTHWTATFTCDAPSELVAQFFTHLASDIPAERSLRELPHLVQHGSSALITPVRAATVNSRTPHAVAQAARTHPGPRPRR